MHEGFTPEPTGSPPPLPFRVPQPVPPAGPVPSPGLPPPPMTGWGPQAEDPRVKAAWTKAIAALVLAGANFLVCSVLCIPALVLAVLALVGLKGVEDPPSHYRVLAILALVLASLGLLLILGMEIVLLLMYVTQGNWP